LGPRPGKKGRMAGGVRDRPGFPCPGRGIPPPGQKRPGGPGPAGGPPGGAEKPAGRTPMPTCPRAGPRARGFGYRPEPLAGRGRNFRLSLAFLWARGYIPVSRPGTPPGPLSWGFWPFLPPAGRERAKRPFPVDSGQLTPGGFPPAPPGDFSAGCSFPQPRPAKNGRPMRMRT
jgi:hypothetical protein